MKNILSHPGIQALALSIISILFFFDAVWVIQSESWAGLRWWWLNDDAMVSMRYARHLADGLGLEWNAGERVEGYSNLAWVLAMTGLHGLGLPPRLASSGVLGLCAICIVALVFATARLARSVKVAAIPAGMVVAGLALNRHVHIAATEGLETLMVAALWCASLAALFKEHNEGRATALPWFIAGMIGFVRADGFVWALAIIPAAVALNGFAGPWHARLLWLLAPAAGQFAFRFYYFAEWIPNTAMLKVQGIEARWSGGLNYILDFAGRYKIVLLAALGAVVFSRGRQAGALLAACIFPTAYIVWTGGDFLPSFRFCLPMLAPLMVVSALAISGLSRRPANLWVYAIILVLTQPVVFINYKGLLGRMKGSGDQVRMGIELKAAAAQGMTLGSAWAGRLFYFSDIKGIDFLGKTDSYIARQHSKTGNDQIAHAKYDYSYSLERRRPDFVFADFPPNLTARDSERMPAGHIQDLFNYPWFQQHCYKNALMRGSRGSLYRCQ